MQTRRVHVIILKVKGFNFSCWFKYVNHILWHILSPNFYALMFILSIAQFKTILQFGGCIFSVKI